MKKMLTPSAAVLAATLYLSPIDCMADKNAIVQNSRSALEGKVGKSKPAPMKYGNANVQNRTNDCTIVKNCFYSNLSSLRCGKNEIVISAVCVSNDDFNSDPYCFIQNVNFVHQRSRQAKSFTYYYDKDRQEYIHAAICIKTENEFYVELKSTNLGNCKICEWSNYFDQQGKYIGSENGRHGKTNFEKKSLPPKKKEMIRQGSIVHRIDITTVAQ